MKAKILGGAALAAATVSLALSGAAPAQAKGKAHHATKPAHEKSSCGGKNGCPGMGKGEDKAAAPAAAKPEATKSEAANPEAAKPADGK